MLRVGSQLVLASKRCALSGRGFEATRSDAVIKLTRRPISISSLFSRTSVSESGVWVTWKSKEGEDCFDRIDDLGDDDLILDLRRSFVKQQNYQTRPAGLTVRDSSTGNALEEDMKLFTLLADSNQGIDKSTAVGIEFPSRRKYVHSDDATSEVALAHVSMGELYCCNVHQLPISMNPQDSFSATVLCKEWLKSTVKTIKSNAYDESNSSDEKRAPPLCLTSCVGGGKTRSLYKIAEKLREVKPALAVLLVSFDDGISDLTADEHEDPLSALTRRIAFAASRDEKTADNFDSNFRHLVVSVESVQKWLGDTRCVLLMDDLHSLSSKYEETPKNPFGNFIKASFLDKSWRYCVYTSHSMDDSSPKLLGLKSNRPPKNRPLPLISSLQGPLKLFDWPDLSIRKAMYYGLTPSLLLMEKLGACSIPKREIAVKEFIDEGLTETEHEDKQIVLGLLGTLIDGDPEGVPKSLQQLMGSDKNGKVLWIPDHMCYLLTMLAPLYSADGEVSEFSMNLRRICALFQKFRDARPRSPDGLQALFTLTLLVRILTKRSHEILDLGDLVDEDYHSSYNRPFSSEPGEALSECTNFSTFMRAIPNQLQDGKARAVVYEPPSAQFPTYHSIVVMWGSDGKKIKTIGYKFTVTSSMSSVRSDKTYCQNSFMVRGEAPLEEPSSKFGWIGPSERQIETFLGPSCSQWTPKKWSKFLV